MAYAYFHMMSLTFANPCKAMLAMSNLPVVSVDVWIDMCYVYVVLKPGLQMKQSVKSFRSLKS